MSSATTHHIHTTDARGKSRVVAFSSHTQAWLYYHDRALSLGLLVGMPMANNKPCTACDNIDENTEVDG